MTNVTNESVVPMISELCQCAHSVPSDGAISGALCSWITAIGSLLLAIIAIFQSWFKSLWKAKLSFSITNDCPHFIVEATNGLTGKLWVEVHNNSDYIDAESVRVVVEEIKTRVNASEAGAYKRIIKLHPQHLCWSARSDAKGASLTIAPESSEFVHIATIACPIVNTRNASGKNPPKNPSAIPRLTIVSRDNEQPIVGDFQDVIIRLRVTCTTSRVQYLFLRISWQGTSGKHLQDQAKDFLCCQRLEKDEYYNLSGDEK